MCGEHRSIVGIGVACQGSSPHVRGALNHSQDCKNRQGIIPACAGSTCLSMMELNAGRDHPRMCGEHSFVFCRRGVRQGSSPHVRGAQDGKWFCYQETVGSSPHVRGARNACTMPCSRFGIIPACAGSTHSADYPEFPNRDHPRMCGEH